MKLIFILLLLLTAIISGCSMEKINLNEIFIDYSKPRIKVAENLSEINQTNTTEIVLPDHSYLVGAWNIEIFGKTKAENVNVYPVIVNVINDYDIIGIQEIRDNTGTVTNKLSEIPNMNIITSERLGRTDSKEQYAFVYSNRVQLMDRATYPDVDDRFEREPLIAQFRVENYSMALILVHIKPDDAKNEIHALEDVVIWTKKEFDEKDVFIIGDLNAYAPYYNYGKDLQDYTWLIEDGVDTTISRSNATYDRIIGTEIFDGITWGIDNLTDETNENQQLLEAMSNHYPVWFEVTLQ